MLPDSDGITIPGVVPPGGIGVVNALLDALPTGAYLCDTDGLIVYYNRQAVALWGRAPKLRDPGDRFCGASRLYHSDGTPIQHDTCWMALALRDRTEYWGKELVIEQPGGQRRTVLAHANVIRDEHARVVGAVNVLVDITERKQAEADIEFFTLHDPLTRLPNRLLLLDRLHHAMAACARRPQKGAVLFLDLDNFKTINDTAGHFVGDQLLRQVGSRLADSVREGDTVGRFGGDEFVIILEGLSEKPHEAALQAEKVGEKILATLKRPFRVAGHTYHSTASMGIMLFGKNPRIKTVDDVMKRADLAMYQAKAQGRNTLCLFDPDMQATANARVELEAAMRIGLQRREFRPYFQPQVDAEGRLKGAEALMRWHHPQRGLILPAEFIPVAEDAGLIIPMGRLMLEAICTQLASWSKHPDTAHLTLAVNVSAREFHHRDFVKQVLDVIRTTGANPERITLELTESMLLTDVQDTVNKMAVLRLEGVNFSLDDFGTGYSSLNYLKRLPLSELKIAQSFIDDVLTDSSNGAIVRSMITLAQNLGLGVTAEGVETKAVRDYLQINGCSVFQGYLFAPALPIDELEILARQP